MNVRIPTLEGACNILWTDSETTFLVSYLESHGVVLFFEV